jgi:hypothetical protein
MCFALRHIIQISCLLILDLPGFPDCVKPIDIFHSDQIVDNGWILQFTVLVVSIAMKGLFELLIRYAVLCVRCIIVQMMIHVCQSS